jgi:predicted RND superfamily exporter protein
VRIAEGAETLRYNASINLKYTLFDDALFEAGRSRFRAIFLTSITTVAGLAPLIFEESRQAQFLIPMAVSIAYGIAFATVLTLIVLPIFLSASNSIKREGKWLYTNRDVTKEEVERVTREHNDDKRLDNNSKVFLSMDHLSEDESNRLSNPLNETNEH